MVHGKPQLTFGGSQETRLSNTRQRANQPYANRTGKDFASYMPASPAQLGVAGGMGSIPNPGMPSARAGGLSPQLLSQSPGWSTQKSYAAQAREALPGQAARIPGKRSLSQVRASLRANQAAASGAYVQNKQGARISGRPITGRRDIGMIDTRKTPQYPPQSIVPSSVRRSGRTSLTGIDAFANFGAKYQSPLTQSFTSQGFGSKNAQNSLRSLGYDVHIRPQPQTRARLLDDDAAQTAVRVAQHRKKPAALPAGRYPAQSLVPTFYSMAGDGVGSLAAKFESGDDGIAAIGYDRTGGTSYGKYQISSRAGTLSNFLEYLQEKAPDLGRRLAAAGPGNTGGRSGRMPDEWRRIAQEDPTRFENLQSDFIRTSHFEPAMEGIAEATGVSFDSLPRALQEVLFSTAVQHGPAGAVRIISQALESTRGKETLRKGDKAGKAELAQSGKRLIQQIYQLRAGQFSSSTAGVQSAVRQRLRMEMREALDMLS
jgi:hypothetical protein